MLFRSVHSVVRKAVEMLACFLVMRDELLQTLVVQFAREPQLLPQRILLLFVWSELELVSYH